MAIDVGSRFPGHILLDSPAGPVAIDQFLGDGPLIVAFHRMWCPFCQQAARDLLACKDELDSLRARVVIVYREDVETTQRSCGERGIPFGCLTDADRQLEQASDVTKFSLRRYLAFSPAKAVRALRSGSRIGMGTDFLQGRSTFVLDRDGRVVYVHRSVTAADIPRVDDVLAATRTAVHDGSRG